jgi:PhnB protein
MAKAAKKNAKSKAATKAAPKIDPLNRKNYAAITPMLTVRDIPQAVAFYTTVLGFKLRNVMEGPNGPVHAELRLRDSTLMLSPELVPEESFMTHLIGRTPVTLYALVENADDVIERAVSAGATSIAPISDMYWGDRAGIIADPDGNRWTIATHRREPTAAQIREAIKKQMAQAASQDRQAAAAASAGSESEY